MLVLSRRIGEQICIGGQIEVTVLEVRGTRVRLGISAPSSTPILRKEIIDSGNAVRCGESNNAFLHCSGGHDHA